MEWSAFFVAASRRWTRPTTVLDIKLARGRFLLGFNAQKGLSLQQLGVRPLLGRHRNAKKSVSRREVLKKAGAITASTFGASFALAGEPEKAPGTSAEATVSTDGGKAIGSELSPEQQALEKLWKEHLASEFKAKSAEAAVNTMVERLSVNHVPIMTGGVGRKQLTHFYSSGAAAERNGGCTGAARPARRGRRRRRAPPRLMPRRERRRGRAHVCSSFSSATIRTSYGSAVGSSSATS